MFNRVPFDIVMYGIVPMVYGDMWSDIHEEMKDYIFMKKWNRYIENLKEDTRNNQIKRVYKVEDRAGNEYYHGQIKYYPEVTTSHYCLNMRQHSQDLNQ